jgi:hypothetical protein
VLESVYNHGKPEHINIAAFPSMKGLLSTRFEATFVAFSNNSDVILVTDYPAASSLVLQVTSLGSARTVCITAYDGTFGDFPAKLLCIHRYI